VVERDAVDAVLGKELRSGGENAVAGLGSFFEALGRVVAARGRPFRLNRVYCIECWRKRRGALSGERFDPMRFVGRAIWP